MRNYIETFPRQLAESLELSNNYQIDVQSTFSNIVICGLGGSGIGGEIAKECVRPYLKMPVEVCHSYSLPEYVGKNSLVILCSYSGNTEETLSAFEDAMKREARIVGITSGGTLNERLSEAQKEVIRIPGGLPPRAALGYALVQLFEVMIQLKCIPEEVKKALKRSVLLLEKEQAEIVETAGKIVEFSGGEQLLMYGEDRFRPVLLRTCQQINENSKELAFYNVVPEMNHNEIVGWAEKPKGIVPLMVRSTMEFGQNKKRLDITHEVLTSKMPVFTLQAKGDTLIEQMLYLIHVMDWFSLLRAEQKGIDVVEVKVIDYLKKQLVK